MGRVSNSNLIGAIIDCDTVEKAMQATLADYLPTYLGELERLKGYTAGQIARPAGVITASEFAKWPEDQLPLIMVVSPGLEGSPVRSSGAGAYDAQWSVTVAAVVADVDELETRRLMSSYAAAIRAAVVQHKALRSSLHPNGFAQFAEWRDESYSDIPFGDTRALDSCRVVFTVGVENVVTQAAGPRLPLPDPSVDPGPWPPVTEVDVDVEPERVIA